MRSIKTGEVMTPNKQTNHTQISKSSIKRKKKHHHYTHIQLNSTQVFFFVYFIFTANKLYFCNVKFVSLKVKRIIDVIANANMLLTRDEMWKEKKREKESRRKANRREEKERKQNVTACDKYLTEICIKCKMCLCTWNYIYIICRPNKTHSHTQCFQTNMAPSKHHNARRIPLQLEFTLRLSVLFLFLLSIYILFVVISFLCDTVQWKI